ncbi:MAG: hypothetical protein LBR89_03530 [Holosporales bacterium]|jgi:hypothetical protein|nr:hypothetical protein [Holosporales bacterium]
MRILLIFASFVGILSTSLGMAQQGDVVRHISDELVELQQVGQEPVQYIKHSVFLQNEDYHFEVFECTMSPMLAGETNVNVLGIMTRHLGENFVSRWKESRRRRGLSADVFKTVSSDVAFRIP